MTPTRILTAIEIGQSALDNKHSALGMLWRKFAASVRSERKRLGISMVDFAGRLDYSPAMLGMLETGKRVWPLEKAKLAAEILKQ